LIIDLILNSLFMISGLPSARTLRGGASIVARGRYGSHAGSLNEVPNSAMSNYSNYSSSSSR
jgi:hypothetical protein